MASVMGMPELALLVKYSAIRAMCQSRFVTPKTREVST